MTGNALIRLAAFTAVAALAAPAAGQSQPADEFCVDCLRVRVGPPLVVRGPFADELDAPFTAVKLADGSFRAFSANGITYAIEGPALTALDAERQPVLAPGAPDSINDCGSWLTTAIPQGDTLLGFVHQERACDYDRGKTEKSMAIATSTDDGLTWTDLGTVITGSDTPQPDTVTGEGDCTMVDAADGFLYAYCLRNSDWQTIVARAPVTDPTDWRKYHGGAWDQPGLGGEATAIGFLGPGAAYMPAHDLVATVATDPWFGGVRLALSADKVSFADLDEPLLPIDGADWNRPADTELVAYDSLLDPATGGNTIGDYFLLGYVYVPAGQGFESRYLVLQDVSLTLEASPLPVQVGLALTRWSDPATGLHITSTGALTGDRASYTEAHPVAHLLTRAPEGIDSIKVAECSSTWPGHLDQLLAEDGTCQTGGYLRERTAGWLFTAEGADTVPVYRCYDEEAATHFASNAADCEGLGSMEFLLGYGLRP